MNGHTPVALTLPIQGGAAVQPVESGPTPLPSTNKPHPECFGREGLACFLCDSSALARRVSWYQRRSRFFDVIERARPEASCVRLLLECVLLFPSSPPAM